MTDRLDVAALTRIATGYLARYAASTHGVRHVLERRLRRWHLKRELPVPEDAGRMVDEVLARLVTLGLVDDRAFMAGKARSLVRKGWPERRIRAELGAAGLDPAGEDLDAVLESDDAVQARRYAARKRLGPHRAQNRVAWRDKDIRSLMRAGFSHRVAAAAIDAGLADEEVEPLRDTPS